VGSAKHQNLSVQFERLVPEVDAHRSKPTKNIFTEHSVYTRPEPSVHIGHVDYSDDQILLALDHPA